MKVREIGTRGIVFTFYELDGYPTNVLVIRGDTYIFVCDTFLGPNSMEGIKSYLNYHYGENPYIVFNSHSHWDHIWGNCAFQDSMIVSHALCRDIIKKEGESELHQYGAYSQGPVKIVLPTVTFQKSISFPSEGVKFFHTPGHTKDSASCFDCIDNTLFVGDNVEAPIPYLFYDNLSEYMDTLQIYVDMEANIVLGHGTTCDESLVQENREYIEAFMHNDTEKYEKGEYQHLHQANLKIQEELKK